MNVPETFFTVSEELWLFGISCLSGAVIGVAYDIFRTFRLIVPHNSWLVATEDILFLALYGVFISAFSSAAARGELRFYFIIGNLIGFVLYFVTLGSVVIRTLRKLFTVIGTALRWLFRPVKTCYVFFRKKAADKFVGNPQNTVKIIKKIKRVLLNKPEMMYNKKENKQRKNVKSVAKKNEARKEKRAVQPRTAKARSGRRSDRLRSPHRNDQ